MNEEDITLEELSAELEQFATDLGQTTIADLNEIARQLGRKLESEMFGTPKLKDRSYGLRNSISVDVNGYKLSLSMKAYGYFQVFGVNGWKVKGAFGLPDSVLTALDGTPNELNKFKFGVNSKHPGLEPIKPAARLIDNLEDLIVNTLSE